LPGAPELPVDEVNYSFIPSHYGYDMERYYLDFSRKSLKRLRRDLAVLEKSEFTYRHDHAADFASMVQLNRERFGESSYFHDQRFSRSFLELMRLLSVRGWLRMTTILHGKTPVAVDMGCLYGGSYTLFAGGTHGAYPGIAKVINLYHMARACRERFTDVDFLCGSFSWKTLFHLTPRPLFLLSDPIPSLETTEVGGTMQTVRSILGVPRRLIEATSTESIAGSTQR
jgi:CelD/BcsL family acetyltransferase involved in cellulose biosynthesis